MAWELEPGEMIRRVELHDRFGGQRQGGIGPSRRTPNVFIFTDPGRGEQHGYTDRWDGEDLLYVGEGQRADHSLDRGNGAILNHKEQGRALRVFYGAAGIVQYAGQFELDDDRPYGFEQARSTNDGPMRTVVVFRLRPVGTAIAIDSEHPTRRLVQSRLSTPYRDVDPTKGAAPRDPFEIDPDKIDRGLRGHFTTQQQLAELVRSHGLEPISPGPGDPNFDLAWRSDNGVAVVEVKSLTRTNEAGQLRLGLGQILDYADALNRTRELARPILALECAPGANRWLELCRQHGVALVWPATFPTLFAPAP